MKGYICQRATTNRTARIVVGFNDGATMPNGGFIDGQHFSELLSPIFFSSYILLLRLSPLTHMSRNRFFAVFVFVRSPTIAVLLSCMNFDTADFSRD